MKRDDINRSRGHALYLKNMFSIVVAKCDAIVSLANMLDECQIIDINSEIFDLLCKARDVVIDFEFSDEEATHDC